MLDARGAASCRWKRQGAVRHMWECSADSRQFFPSSSVSALIFINPNRTLFVRGLSDRESPLLLPIALESGSSRQALQAGEQSLPGRRHLLLLSLFTGSVFPISTSTEPKTCPERGPWCILQEESPFGSLVLFSGHTFDE